MKKITPIELLFLNNAKMRSLSNDECADIIGISRRSFYSVLRGDKKLKLHEANTICGEFGIPLDLIAKAEHETIFGLD